MSTSCSQLKQIVFGCSLKLNLCRGASRILRTWKLLIERSIIENVDCVHFSHTLEDDGHILFYCTFAQIV